jgi:hypothetical protein
VPTIEPACVSVESEAMSRSLAMPKSTTLTDSRSWSSSAGTTMMLSGLRSRWTISRRWAAPTPAQMSRASEAARATGSLPSRRKSSRRERPRTSSITM